jgi:Tat protein translocase TatB subunit
MAFIISNFPQAYFVSEQRNNTFTSKIQQKLIGSKFFFGKNLKLNFNKITNKKIFVKKSKNVSKRWVAVFGPGGGFLGVGTSELIVIGAVAWLVLGPKRLLQLARDIGKISGEIKNVADEARQTFQQAIDVENLETNSQLSKTPLNAEMKNTTSTTGNKKKAMKNLDDLVKTEISTSEKKNE